MLVTQIDFSKRLKEPDTWTRHKCLYTVTLSPIYDNIYTQEHYRLAHCFPLFMAYKV